MSRYYDYYSYKPKRTPPSPIRQLEKLRKKNPDIQPVIIDGKLAKSWWAQAWNRNLESYADYDSRIGRGRSYVRNGSVLDLKITPGMVHAVVSGSKANPYSASVEIAALNKEKWDAITRRCNRKIGNLEELVSGKFPQELMELFTDKGDGIFPSPKEIKFSCTCPDWAYMCKHVAAVLYGIGARFDNDPTLFFMLRDIDFSELIKKSVDDKMKSMLKNAGKPTKRVMDGVDTYELFGV